MARKKNVVPVDLSTDMDQRVSSLFKLPRELRICIYELVAEDSALKWRPHGGNSGRTEQGQTIRRGDGKPKAPGMILACKQMHQEFIPILCARCRFQFHLDPAFTPWLKSISDDNLKVVKKV
jgi:hypothetical protein